HAAAESCACLAFFFQAEDGIRDFHVTGVQTCALPISDAEVPAARDGDPADTPTAADPETDAAPRPAGPAAPGYDDAEREAVLKRSVERRVGKESRSGWTPARRERKSEEQGETDVGRS